MKGDRYFQPLHISSVTASAPDIEVVLPKAADAITFGGMAPGDEAVLRCSAPFIGIGYRSGSGATLS